MTAGLCQCGCGRKTEIAIRTVERVPGFPLTAGQPKPFWGKHHRWPKRKPKTLLRSSSGRWYVKCVDGSQVYWYRIVAEDMLGRPLLSTEQVHHRNGDKTDDRPENLEILPSVSAHSRIHGDEKIARRRPCSACGADRTTAKRTYHPTLCMHCWVRTDVVKRRAAASYARHREQRKAQRDARRTRQRALGLKVT